MSAVLAPPPAVAGPFPRPWTPAELTRMLALGLFPGRAVALSGGRLVEAVPGSPAPRPVLLTISDYAALWSAWLHNVPRVQLINGVIVQEPPMNPPHATGVQLVSSELGPVFRRGYSIRVQIPLDFVRFSRPHPDVAVVTGSVRDYATQHPVTAVLVVEVSDDSLFEDTTTKAELYAAAGIADYWVLDVTGRQLLVFRDPRAISAGGYTYHTSRTLGPDDSVAPLAAPQASVQVADLLP